MWRSLMKQGLKNSFNKNYLWVTIAGTNMVDHDSDINLFVYFSYNLLLMRKRFSFCDKKMLGYITQRVLSIAMISINFTVKLDWLAKLLHGNSRGSNTESGLSENWEAEYWIYYWDKLSNQLKEQIYLILRLEILDNYHRTSYGTWVGAMTLTIGRYRGNREVWWL